MLVVNLILIESQDMCLRPTYAKENSEIEIVNMQQQQKTI